MRRAAAYHKEKEIKKEIRLMLEYECYPLWIYDEKGSLIDNDLIDEIKKDDTLCGMLEGLQTEFERLYVNNQIEFKYVGFSSENAKQNFAKKTENIHSRLCKLLEDKYTRAEAIELTDSLIKKLSSKIETLSDVNINDCDNLEISIYLQQNGKEFISLIEKSNIKNELAEYNNQTIAMVLSKILPSAIELEKEKRLRCMTE